MYGTYINTLKKLSFSEHFNVRQLFCGFEFHDIQWKLCFMRIFPIPVVEHFSAV